MHTNKVVRTSVDSSKAANASVAHERVNLPPESVENSQTKIGTPAAAFPINRPPTIVAPKRSRVRRFLARVFRSAIRPFRPFFHRYREFHNRPLVDQLSRIENTLANQHSILKYQTKIIQALERRLDERFDVLNTEFASCQASLLNIESRLALQQRILEDLHIFGSATARRVAVNCGEGRILLKSSVGYVMCSPTDSSMIACLIDTGELELGTRLLIEKLVHPNTVFVDVGANIGLHTLAAARSMQGSGKIFAFEPFGPTASLLSESVMMNGFGGLVDVHRVAVSSESGTHQFYLGEVSGHHSLYPLEQSKRQSIQVPVVTLSEVIPLKTQINLLKIDVEGAEIEVLKSAEPFIEANPDIGLIVEFGPSHLERVGVSIEDWFEQFSSLGLVFKAIDPYTGTLNSSNIQTLAQLESINLLFARRESSVWAKTCAAN